MIVTDVSHLIVAVERCGVTARLDWPEWGSRSDIQDLIGELDVVTHQVAWKRISSGIESPVDLEAEIP